MFIYKLFKHLYVITKLNTTALKQCSVPELLERVGDRIINALAMLLVLQVTISYVNQLPSDRPHVCLPP